MLSSLGCLRDVNRLGAGHQGVDEVVGTTYAVLRGHSGTLARSVLRRLAPSLRPAHAGITPRLTAAANASGAQTYSLPVEPEEFISQSAWEKLSHQEQDDYVARFSESLRAVLQGRNSDRALLFADHWDDLASWTRSEWSVMLENAGQLEARLEELVASPELSEADRSWAAESLENARATREHKGEPEDL